MANYNVRRALNFLGFVATMLIGIVMLLAVIVNGVSGGTIAGLNLRGASISSIIFAARLYPILNLL